MQKQTSGKKYRVLIVGGGFAGVKTALDLSDNNEVDITLISDDDNFHYHATLYKTATGGSKLQTLIPLSDIFKDKTVSVVKGRTVKLNRKNKSLSTADGKHYKYDTLVLALGSVTNYFGIKGLRENSFGIKNYQEAAKLKKHLHAQLVANRQPDFNYIVVGGGPSGAELAGVLPTYIKRLMKSHDIKHRAVNISLVEATNRVLPTMPKDVSLAVARRLRKLGVRLLLGKSVSGASASDLIVDGKPIKSSSVIWTAGITNHPFFSVNNFLLDDHSRVKVNEYLEAEPDIYVLGDNASTPHSGMAQTAIRDGDLCAKNIKRQLEDKPLQKYKPRRPLYITPVGARWAAVVYGNLRIYGRLGWVVRRVMDWLGYHEVEPWDKASQQWLAGGDEEENCPYCAVNNQS